MKCSNGVRKDVAIPATPTLAVPHRHSLLWTRSLINTGCYQNSETAVSFELTSWSRWDLGRATVFAWLWIPGGKHCCCSPFLSLPTPCWGKERTSGHGDAPCLGSRAVQSQGLWADPALNQKGVQPYCLLDPSLKGSKNMPLLWSQFWLQLTLTYPNLFAHVFFRYYYRFKLATLVCLLRGLRIYSGFHVGVVACTEPLLPWLHCYQCFS